jgi:hypothetical protein
MNEPYAHPHELSQAKRLVQLLESYASNQSVWLCLNFNLGGKAIDGALIFKDCFIILELKAVSGDVDCGKSLENSAWTWSSGPFGESHKIQTSPYANPFSQIKSYRTAVIGEFDQPAQENVVAIISHSRFLSQRSQIFTVLGIAAGKHAHEFIMRQHALLFKLVDQRSEFSHCYLSPQSQSIYDFILYNCIRVI